MTSSIVRGTFWFPIDRGHSFAGTISNEEELLIEVNSAEDSNYVSQTIADKNSILINGELDGKILTAVAYPRHRKINSMATPYTDLLVFGIKWLFYNEHFRSLDIRLKGLVVIFTDITDWITPHDIIFPEAGEHREVWKVDIHDSCSIKFIYKRPISKSDDVYIRIESPGADRSFRELFEEMITFQDFLNFVITKDTVLTKSVMGVIGNQDEEKLIEVKYKTPMLRPSDKCRVTGPSLFHCRQYGEDRLPDTLRKWFELKREHRIVYNFYVDSLYESDAIELSYFRCVAFLEGYHRQLIEAKEKSRIKAQKELYFSSIMNRLKAAEVFQYNKLEDLLNRLEIKELNLAHRLKEIWESNKELISLNVPITPFFNAKDIRKMVMRATADTDANRRLYWYLLMKFDADSEGDQQERRKRYKEILKFFQSEHIGLTFRMLHFVEDLLIDHFPKKFAIYRNAIAHVLSDVYESNHTKWYYAFKIMQLTSQLCML